MDRAALPPPSKVARPAAGDVIRARIVGVVLMLGLLLGSIFRFDADPYDVVLGAAVGSYLALTVVEIGLYRKGKR